MAVPKKRSSITARRLRRSHDRNNLKSLAQSCFLDQNTSEININHRAKLQKDGTVLYRGQTIRSAVRTLNSTPDKKEA